LADNDFGKRNRRRFMRITLAALVLLALAGCGTDTPTASQTAAEPTETPTPNYAEEKSGTYYYVGGVSDNDKAEGKAAGDVMAFRYLGKNAEGEHKVLFVDDDGSALITATCPDQCRIISASTGDKYPYDPQAMIGSVFEDVLAGRLEVYKPKK
jgi:hypothetical protein